MQKCMANLQATPAPRRANWNAASAARASRTPCRDSVRTASGRIGTGRSLEEPQQTCVCSARCDALSRERRRLFSHDHTKEAPRVFPWWAPPSGRVAMSLGGFSLCFSPDAPRALGFRSRHLTIMYGDSRRLLRHSALTLWGARVAVTGKPPVVRPVTLWFR